MNQKYLLRKNFKAAYVNNSGTTYGKLAFKTQETTWLDTSFPVVSYVSIYSSFHKEIEGDLKMNAFLSTIRANVRGKISILFTDTAHLHTFSLLQPKNPCTHCIQEAKELTLRYSPYLKNEEILYWHSFVSKDQEYLIFKEELQVLAQTDKAFQAALLSDAKTAYTPTRCHEYPNEELFIEKTILDLIEQCICIQILAREGYRYIFYPGAPAASTEYINKTLISPDMRIQWVDVFLSIEEKKKNY